MTIDEDDFLRDLFPHLTSDVSIIVPPGDDCAAICLANDEYILVTVDQVAAGTHYVSSDGCSPTLPGAVGRKLVARNISDIAAMGGRPCYGLLALAVEKHCERRWLDQLARGVTDAAREFGFHIIGGDICAARAGVAGLTLIGAVAPEHICTRNGARANDALFVTGYFGASFASGKHLTFSPRLDEGRWLAEHGCAHAMIDASDGLLKDLHRLCAASGVTAVIDETTIPRTVRDGVSASVASALLDGEDYELIVAVPQHKQHDVATLWPFCTPLTCIGAFRPEGNTPSVRNRDGEDLLSTFGKGFEHFTAT